jgi:hypothetical protein
MNLKQDLFKIKIILLSIELISAEYFLLIIFFSLISRLFVKSSISIQKKSY